MLVKYSCGCTGLHGVPVEGGGTLLITRCDDAGCCEDPYDMAFSSRDMGTKSFTPMTEGESMAMVKNLAKLVADGLLYRDLHRQLRRMVKD